MGPYLYALLTNNVTTIFKFAKVVIYADDVSLYAVVINENDYKAFQYNLNNVYIWSTERGLKIYYNKCKIIHFVKQITNFNILLTITY